MTYPLFLSLDWSVGVLESCEPTNCTVYAD